MTVKVGWPDDVIRPRKIPYSIKSPETGSLTSTSIVVSNAAMTLAAITTVQFKVDWRQKFKRKVNK